MSPTEHRSGIQSAGMSCFYFLLLTSDRFFWGGEWGDWGGGKRLVYLLGPHMSFDSSNRRITKETLHTQMRFVAQPVWLHDCVDSIFFQQTRGHYTKRYGMRGLMACAPPSNDTFISAFQI